MDRGKELSGIIKFMPLFALLRVSHFFLPSLLGLVSINMQMNKPIFGTLIIVLIMTQTYITVDSR